MKWYNCKPISEYASKSLCVCRKDGDYVIFFNEDNCWIRIPAEKARQHFKITGEAVDSNQIEDAYQWSLKQNLSATSSGGSKSDTASTSSDVPVSPDPGPTTE